MLNGETRVASMKMLPKRSYCLTYMFLSVSGDPQRSSNDAGRDGLSLHGYSCRYSDQYQERGIEQGQAQTGYYSPHTLILFSFGANVHSEIVGGAELGGRPSPDGVVQPAEGTLLPEESSVEQPKWQDCEAGQCRRSGSLYSR